MSIKSIIIDNKTKAERISPDKVQLNLIAMPFNEQNDTEPNLGLRLYVNDQLLKNLKSDMNGYIRELLIIDDKESDSISVKIEEITSNIQSSVKHIFIQTETPQQPQQPVQLDNKYINLYKLHEQTLTEFNVINSYFQEITKSENGHDQKFINNEFAKIGLIAQLKYKIKSAKELEFYDKYKDRIETAIAYCKNSMTIYEIGFMVEEIQKIITDHNANINRIKQEINQQKIEEDAEKARLEKENSNQEIQRKIVQQNEEKIEQENKIRQEEEIQRKKNKELVLQQIDSLLMLKNEECDNITLEINEISGNLEKHSDLTSKIEGYFSDIYDKEHLINRLEKLKSFHKECANLIKMASSYQEQYDSLKNTAKLWNDHEKQAKDILLKKRNLEPQIRSYSSQIAEIKIPTTGPNGEDVFAANVDKKIILLLSDIRELKISKNKLTIERDQLESKLNGARDRIEMLIEKKGKIEKEITELQNKKSFQ